MSLDYNTYVSQIANLMVISSADANFQTMLPGMIDYAEQRIYRELDLLYTQANTFANISSGERVVSLPAPSSGFGQYIVVDNINVITPVPYNPATATNNQLVPTSREFIDLVYPSNTLTGLPLYWCMRSNDQIILGPAPAEAYTIEVIGMARPAALSSGNSSTFLTQYVPDVFIAASMVFGSAYQRDFSLTGDNPQQGQSWESQYQVLIKSAMVEQVRAKYEAEGWGSNQPSPIATPPRV